MSGDNIKTGFQNFDEKSDGKKGPERLAALRRKMQEKNLDAWLIPLSDEYQNEYPPARAQRLAWLTGFTGSAGFCIVTREDAMVFTDGRYTLQVSKQIETDHFTPADPTKIPPHKWLETWLTNRTNSRTTRIGFDPWLATVAAKKQLEKRISSYGAQLVGQENLVDLIWQDQPGSPLEPVSIQPDKFSGKLARQKIEELKTHLSDNNADLCLITDPASIAWMFNIRGEDLPHTPLALGYCVLQSEGFPLLFMDKRKMSREVEAYLTQLADIHPPSRLDEELAAISSGKTILADPAKISVAMASIITARNGKIVEKTDPVILPRAIKNEAEIQGSHDAHLRDGVAVTKFLYWLDQQKPGTIDEVAAARSLENFRRTTAGKFQSELADISFDTISGAGANGAIVHYRVTRLTSATLENNSLYLVDSGGQYRDGTTDITRTIAIGTAPADAIEDFTLVLKGHIAIATARFPVGTRGVDLDPLARIALWQQGRDYAHGTGHGVGSFLAVHEGPQGISRKAMSELKPGMILSNEPGFYREGKYGIRIENLVLVKEPIEFEGGNIAVMGFETLSLAPIDLRLVDPGLMNQPELHWLNAYHGWIKRQFSRHLEESEAKWLEDATRPLSNELPAASA
ncbi:MAG: aminopeptidase P family protein [Rhizobiaceae bacterium]|nr:aminopeptidase P family protein [Rhizobiaceae bacterium]